MRIKPFFITAVLAFSTLAVAQPPDTGGGRPWARPNDESIPDRLIVQERSGADPDTVTKTFKGKGAGVLKHNAALNASVLSVDPAKRDAIQAELESTGLFTYVEPDYVAQVTATPSDPNFSYQWHLATIQAPSAWNITTGSSAITIGVIDSGVDGGHPDLAGKLVAGWSFLNGSSNTQDTFGHGTATAGTIAAATNNGTGVAGIVWQNRLMPLQVVDPSGYASYSNIASAITYAADHGIRIVNISIAGTASSSTLQNAVNYAWGKGTLIFASAGNAGNNTPNYPAACQNVMAVSATSSSDAHSSFSSFGSFVSLSAPGEGIFTTSMGGGYGYWSGTSFSAPIAAGVAALALSNSPGLSVQALVNALKTNSDDLGAAGYDQYFGYGRVNAYRAVNGTGSSSDTTPPSVSISTPANGSTVQASISVQGTATDNVGVSRIEFYVDGNLKATVFSSPFSFSWDTTTASSALHTLAVKSFDAANNMGQASVSVTVNNPPPADSQAPTVSVTAPGNGQTVSGSIQITASASDNVGVTQVSFYVDGVLQNTDSGAPYGFSYDTTKLANGSHSITAKAWDQVGNVGNSAVVTLNVNNAVSLNGQPLSVFASVSSVAPGGNLSVSWTAPPGSSATDWIALFRVGAPNTDYGLWWHFATGATSGTFNLTAPTQTGEYEFRYLPQNGYVDVARSNPVTVTSSTYTLTPSPTSVAPGGNLSVSWTAPPGSSATDWIGLFPVGAPNTGYAWWQSANGATSGTFNLVAPSQTGQYEFRYLLQGGYTDVARSTPITVTNSAYTLTPSPTSVFAAGSLSVSWTAPPGSSTTDWIGLFRVGAANTEYGLWWRVTAGATSGTFNLTAPVQTGQYEFRYLPQNGYLDVLRSTVVTVK